MSLGSKAELERKGMNSFVIQHVSPSIVDDVWYPTWSYLEVPNSIKQSLETEIQKYLSPRSEILTDANIQSMAVQ
ncbi:hypothetical protein CEXT_242921 [Caerostris extrusa]|uniref:Uncharacterized protein n=1 Tax=Caerostris extrusa TaxID=172846 RepID=A0AAV4P3V3_CAEEX|nr:hypothetical protein CEXT_242921 [Caerostris extrusa]